MCARSRRCVPVAHLGDVGHSIQTFVEERNYSWVREKYCGHGNRALCIPTNPQVLHYGEAWATGSSLKAYDLHIEADGEHAGKRHVRLPARRWTGPITNDHSLFCAVEHTVLGSPTPVSTC